MTERRSGRMSVGAFFKNTGHHIASWRHPEAQVDAGINIEHYCEMAKLAEACRFDFLFFADSLSVRDAPPEILSRNSQFVAYFEPVTLLSAFAMVTKHIGLVATSTTSYNDPYHVARRYASLDHISHGRAGWNVVTSGFANEAYNFGRDAHYEHTDRYVRAKEFVEVVQHLWDSWDDDAFVYDRAEGRYFDPSKVRAINHHGDLFKVKGPLNVPRPPQGYPVIFQAGSSEDGRNLAAATAEGVFNGELQVDRAKAYYDDVKGRMTKYGRTPDQMRILPGLTAIVARTEKEAIEKRDYLATLIHPVVGRAYTQGMTGGYDLSDYDVDEQLPEFVKPKLAGTISDNVIHMARTENMTIRQIYERLAGSHGKLSMVGSPGQIVDQMQIWYDAHACDGFIIQPSTMPGELKDVAELLVPELQERGLMRTEYEGETLRDNMGLARPPSRYAA